MRTLSWRDSESQRRRLEGVIESLLALWAFKTNFSAQILPHLENLDPLECMNKPASLDACGSMLHREKFVIKFWDFCEESESLRFILWTATAAWQDHGSIGGKISDIQELIRLNRDEVELYIRTVIAQDAHELLYKTGFFKTHQAEIAREKHARKVVKKVMER